MSPKILIVDDDASFRRVLEFYRMQKFGLPRPEAEALQPGAVASSRTKG